MNPRPWDCGSKKGPLGEPGVYFLTWVPYTANRYVEERVLIPKTFEKTLAKTKVDCRGLNTEHFMSPFRQIVCSAFPKF